MLLPEPWQTCLDLALDAAAPLPVIAMILQIVRFTYFQRRLRQIGSIVPNLESIEALLQRGCYLGVPVIEESTDRFGGGRFVSRGHRGEIRLGTGMLARRDVDALIILEHELGHAEGDIPTPRLYRMALLGLFLGGLALVIGRSSLVNVGVLAIWIAFCIAALHTLRNEAAASEFALRRIWPSTRAPGLQRQAVTRLGAAFGLYLADWTAAATGLVLVLGLLRCA